MRFSIAIAPLLAASAFGAAEAKKKSQADLLVSEINTISSALVTLNNTVNSFKPFQPLGVTTAMKIQKQTSALQDDISAAINTTMKSSKFNSDDSTLIGITTIGLVDPINSTLTNIAAHKASFASGVLLVGDLTKTVYTDLVQQRNLTAQLGGLLAKKLAAPFNTLAPGVTEELLGFFDTAIKAFEKCTGVVCLPPV